MARALSHDIMYLSRPMLQIYCDGPYLKQRLEQPPGHYREYTYYYEAQALFQGDIEAWEKWNKLLVRQLKELQQPDGSFKGDMGNEVATSLSLLALALNYRFLPIYER